MKKDLVFSSIAWPFTVAVGMFSTRPLLAASAFIVLLLVRYGCGEDNS